MPSDMETLIRTVLAEQADRAPHRATVLAGLRWAAARRPHRRLALAAAGVAVALAAIGVPIGLHLTTQPLMAGTGQVLHVRQPDIPLPYHPTYLPPGYVASLRVAQSTDVSQMWEQTGHDRTATGPHGSNSFIELDVFTSGDLAQRLAHGPSVDINGVRGYVTSSTGEADDGKTIMETLTTWVPKPGVTLELTTANFVNPQDVALRVARSVVAGDTEVIAQPLSFGDLPAGYTADELLIHGTSPSKWTVTRNASSTDNRDPVIDATWSTTQPGLDSRLPVTVRGQQGWYGQLTAMPSYWGVVVALDGHWLTVSMSSGGDMATLIGIANGIAVFPDVTFPWLGR
jgi:hypothetical protein